MEGMDCGAVLKTIDSIVHEPAFVEQCKEFVNQHCEAFTEDAELKLEYTPIHQEYMSVVEEHIAGKLVEKLGEDFDMSGFMEKLPEYVEGQGEEEDSGNAETIEFLMGFGDIENFKDMMLVAKKDKLSDPTKMEGSSNVGFSSEQQKVLEEAKAVVKDLVGALDGDSGWKVVSDKPWCKLERMTKGTDEFVRTTMVLDLPMEQGTDMTLNFSPERHHWDSMMTDCKVVKKIDGEDDFVTTFTLALPMSKPQLKCSRVIVTRDTPEPGAVTYLYLDYDMETQKLKPASESLGAGSLFPIKGDPSKCLIKSVDQIQSSWVPKFIMNWLVTTWFPKMLTSQCGKYKKFKELK